MIIEASEISKHFSGCEALKNLSFAVPEGSAFALIGANGAGKTTTIKVLCNLIAASHGKAKVLGVDSTALSPRELAMLGYVSENQRMPAQLTIGEYLDYLRPFYPSWDGAIEAKLMDLFRLPLDRKIGALSHGARMKCRLTCALSFRPKLLMMDEPFSGIDAVVRDDLLTGLLELAGETTIFVSSHDLSEIEGLITHVAFLEEGRLLFQNSMDELNNRFRAVRVTFDGSATPPSDPPSSWLDIRESGSVLTFVEDNFSETRLREQIAALLGPVRNVEIEPQSLRSIFVALARTASRRGH
jgi:ABC-2 type transport system ATP-binding protein